MSMWRSASGPAVFPSRTVVVLACFLLTGCASGGRTGAGEVPAGAASDWLNATYTVTCDGIVANGFRVTVVDGGARVLADSSRPPHYGHYDVRDAMDDARTLGRGVADGVVDRWFSRSHGRRHR